MQIRPVFTKNQLQHTQNPALNAPANKNGNITSIAYGCGEEHVYGLQYDFQDRLTKATYATYNTFSGAYSNFNHYNEEITAYDKRGNIQHLKRNAGLTNGAFAEIDDLQYTYTDNQLSRISESGAAGSTYWNKGFKTNLGTATYLYDANGNVVRDNHKKITVAYNHLNLPNNITFDDGFSIAILYDANGAKLRKTTPVGVVNYVGGIEYAGTTLQAIYHSEGRCKAQADGSFQYEYNLKDHLGSTWVNFRENAGHAEAIQENQYYPFGMLWGEAASLSNKYTYNGKELNNDNGLGWMDYGARWYDGAVGRWWSVDNLGSHANQIDKSVYVYAWNNPATLTDPDGNLPSNPQEKNDCCNHLLGGLRAVGGLLQMAGGTALAVAPEPTGLTKVGAAIALGHGLDDFQAGIRQAFTDENTESLTFITTKSAVQSLGANEGIAGKIATGTDIGLGFVGGSVFSKAVTSRVVTSEVVGQTVFHATSKEGAAVNILNGIDPKFFNPSSRFGRGFYVAKEQSTMIAELAYHGASPVNTLSFSLSGGKFLNATSPLMDLGTKYIPLTLSGAAKNMGYNGIIFNSLRNLNGINTVIFNNFDLLKQGKIIK